MKNVSKIVESLRDAFFASYLLAQNKISNSDYADAFFKNSVILKENSYDSVADISLKHDLFNENVFFEHRINWLGDKLLPEAYLAKVQKEVHPNFYFCDRSSSFEGLDFYEGVYGDKPTVVYATIDEKIIFDLINIELAYKKEDSSNFRDNLYKFVSDPSLEEAYRLRKLL
jgi:hypothetical protein